MEVLWSVPAEEKLDAIISYIANDNLHAALEIDHLLREAANGLAKFPQKGRPDEFPVHEDWFPIRVMWWCTCWWRKASKS
jgi:plasmid stabilization system protein ParE